MSVMIGEQIEDPVWFLGQLYGELAARQSEMQQWDDYYSGDHPLPFLTKAHGTKMANEFRKLLEDSRSNFMQLIVDAVAERMAVDGIRLSGSSDQQTDRQSWEIWQANQMDAESAIAIEEALIKGVSYLGVWQSDDDEHPTITVEDSMQTIVGYVPGSNYRQRAAALKVWTDEWTGLERANVYMPNGIYKYISKDSVDKDDSIVVSATGPQDQMGITDPAGSVRYNHVDAKPVRWIEMIDDFVPNPTGIVPIVPLRNNPRLMCEGQSDIDGPHRVQNQINGFLFLLALAGYFGAHKQRWAVGLKIHEDADGKPVEPFDVAVDRLFINEDPAGSFGEFGQTDLGGYIKAIEQKVLHIAVTTRTPRHYLIEQGQSPSGDAIKSAESGLTFKTERKMLSFGEGFEEALRLARAFKGQDTPVDSEIVWKNPEVRTEAEITDAAIKKWTLGLISHEQALEDVGYTQVQIERILAAAPEPQTKPETEEVEDADSEDNAS